MDELERRKFTLHAQTDAYQQRVDQAEQWIHRLFDRYNNPCLNYSGGKDSLVLLHLVAAACGYDDVDVFHFDNGVLRVPGSETFVEDSVNRIGGTLFFRGSEAADSPQMLTEEGHGYKGFWGWYRRLQNQQGWDLRLLGIRAEESGKRRDRVDPDSDIPMTRQEEFTAAFPIHHFTTTDIWSYIVEHDLAYHEIYDKQADLYGGIEADGNRLVTIYDSEFDSLGSRTVSQFIYPGRTNELKHIEQDYRQRESEI